MKKRKFFGHNFGVVYRFEVMRTLKKKSFWATILALPLAIAVIGGLSYWAGTSTENSSADLAKQKFSLAITDKSGAISDEIVKSVGAEKNAEKADGISKVESGQADAYFYYPENLAEEKVEVFGQSVGIFENSKYQAVAQSLLKNSAISKTDPAVAAVLQSNISFNSTTFRDGKEYNPLMQMIAPGLFLVLFYLIIAMFGGQMMNSTIEEKENRVSEMILTTIKPRTLIIGKIFAFLTLILIQIIVILGLIATAYFLVKDSMNLPNFDLSQIPLDPGRILAALAIFAFSLLLFSGLLVAIGAAAPTAKEANGFFAVPMLLLFAPLYLVSLMISDPTNPAIMFLTYFPFTSPLPLMIGNAIGNLGAWEIIIGVTILAVTGIIVFIIAARLFATGAVEYSKRMSLKGLFKKCG